MYWYNPKTRSSERVEAPSTDDQAIRMLADTQDSAEFIKGYCKLRRSGTPMEQALVLVHLGKSSTPVCGIIGATIAKPHRNTWR